jgi:hypothetical protein
MHTTTTVDSPPVATNKMTNIPSLFPISVIAMPIASGATAIGNVKDEAYRNAFLDHIEATLGGHSLILADKKPVNGIAIDIVVVPATMTRPFVLLITRGMGERAMMVPDGHDASRFVELAMCLPADWPVTLEGFRAHPASFWPLEQLKRLALYPSQFNTFLAASHTVANQKTTPYVW